MKPKDNPFAQTVITQVGDVHVMYGHAGQRIAASETPGPLFTRARVQNFHVNNATSVKGQAILAAARSRS